MRFIEWNNATGFSRHRNLKRQVAKNYEKAQEKIRIGDYWDEYTKKRILEFTRERS